MKERMNKLKIEILAQKLHNANCNYNREDWEKAKLEWDKAQKEFANWTYMMVLRGRLFCKTENGELRKININD